MSDENEKKPGPPPERPAGAGRSRVIRPARSPRTPGTPKAPETTSIEDAREDSAPDAGSQPSPAGETAPGPAPEAAPEPAPEAPAPEVPVREESDHEEPVSEEPAHEEPVSELPVPGVPDGRPARSRLTALTRLVRPARLSRVQLLAALLLGALGFGLVVQARQTQSGDLSSLSQSELVRVLDDVSRQGERLDAETQDLEQTQSELRSGTDSAAAAEKATRERLAVLGILAGTDPAQGPGVTIQIKDPQALVDASTILDTVQELRDAGAEAIQFGQVRVVASTSFTGSATGGAVITDGVEQSPPYRLVAIGDPATMESALNIPGGVLETLHQVGASGTVQRSKDLTVSAVRQVSSPTYAVPQTDTEE